MSDVTFATLNACQSQNLMRWMPPSDGIENFWSQAKRHLRKYNGIPRHHFHLFLKECEWRFNYGPPAKLFVTLKSWIRRANR